MSAQDELTRKMEMRQRAPFWWPETQTIMQLFLAVAIVAMVGYILQQLLSGEALKIDPSVRDLIVFIFGIIFGNFKDVYGFTYGSSASDKQKGEAINRSIETKDRLIASSVVAAAEAADPAPTPAKSVAVASWWSLLSLSEQAAMEQAAMNDGEVQTALTAFKSGKAGSTDLTMLVSKKLLTQARANEINPI